VLTVFCDVFYYLLLEGEGCPAPWTFVGSWSQSVILGLASDLCGVVQYRTVQYWYCIVGEKIRLANFRSRSLTPLLNTVQHRPFISSLVLSLI
jgi:hypothetical protein